MGSTIRPGSRVLLERAPAPRIGEIWAWCLPTGEIVVHRALWNSKRGHRFQGDARRDLDPPVVADLMIGRVAAIEHQGIRRATGARARWGGLTRLLALNLARSIYHLLPASWRAASRARVSR